MVMKPTQIPYWKTKVDLDRSIQQINKLLAKYGIDAYQWTTFWSKEQVALRCVLEDQNGKKLQIMFQPPPLRKRASEQPNWPASMRMLYTRIKSKLETSTCGFIEIEKEFLNEIVVRDAQGRETTMGALLKPLIDKGLDGMGAVDITKALPALAEGRPLDEPHDKSS